MILIDGVKYSCLECVRGHRSSLCRHHMRPLLQVRSKGRPQIEGPESKNHRIAVFAEEVELPSCKSTPLIILKASGKQIIDLRNGQIVGPYEENPSSQPVIRPTSFVHVNACCSTGVSKVRKRCMCNHKTVSKSEILSSYLTRKKMAPPRKPCCGGGTASKPEHTLPPPLPPAVKQEPEVSWVPTGLHPPRHGDHGPQPEGAAEAPYRGPCAPVVVNERSSFEVIPVPSCLAPGTCSCSAACACPGCVAHDNAPKTEALLFLNNDAQYDSELILTLRADQPAPGPPPAYSAGPPGHLGEMPPADQGASRNGYVAFLQLLLSEPPPHAPAPAPAPPHAPAMDSCRCPDDSCFCTNCEAHGIIDGYRLDDIFAGYGSLPAFK